MVGLALGSLHVIAAPNLTRELLFTFFLPGLLFEAAFHLDLGAFRQVWRSAVFLSVPGVVIAMGIAAGILIGITGLLLPQAAIDFKTALVFAAVVAATDPVAVTALFREVRVPARLTVLIEGESLFNDGVGVVILTLVLAHMTGEASSVSATVVQFALVAGGGVLVGLATGWISSKIIRRLDDRLIEIGLTVIAAYGSFVLAESIRASGVLAIVVAGMMCGREGRNLGMSAASRVAVETFWEYVAFALNSIVFLLIGFQYESLRLAPIWRELFAAVAAVLIARGVIVLSLFGLAAPLRESIPAKWAPVLVWGGLRGALSIVLALSLPESLPNRELITALTVGVVLASIVVQGLSMPSLILGLRLADTATESPVVGRIAGMPREELERLSSARTHVDSTAESPAGHQTLESEHGDSRESH